MYGSGQLSRATLFSERIFPMIIDALLIKLHGIMTKRWRERVCIGEIGPLVSLTSLDHTIRSYLMVDCLASSRERSELERH
jgi:hypothetical protein